MLETKSQKHLRILPYCFKSLASTEHARRENNPGFQFPVCIICFQECSIIPVDLNTKPPPLLS
jgi:hypothetical protein